MVIFAILDLMFSMTREDYLIKENTEPTIVSDDMVEGDTSLEEEPTCDTSDENEVFGEIEEVHKIR